MVEQVCLTDAMLKGMREVFETMIFMDVKETQKQELKIENNGLLSTITFKGSIEGCLGIYFDDACIKDVSMNMLGMDPDEEISKEEICDAAGEVINMVMGSFKAGLMESMGDLEVSIPSVISGRELENSLGENSVKLQIGVNIQDEYLAIISLLYREARN